MLFWGLLIGNIPVYLFLAWLIFDTKDGAAQSFGETLILLVRAIIVPAPLRMLLSSSDSEGGSLLQSVAFLFACGFVIWGEYRLIEKWFGA